MIDGTTPEIIRAAISTPIVSSITNVSEIPEIDFAIPFSTSDHLVPVALATIAAEPAPMISGSLGSMSPDCSKIPNPVAWNNNSAATITTGIRATPEFIENRALRSLILCHVFILFPPVYLIIQ